VCGTIVLVIKIRFLRGFCCEGSGSGDDSLWKRKQMLEILVVVVLHVVHTLLYFKYLLLLLLLAS